MTLPPIHWPIGGRDSVAMTLLETAAGFVPSFVWNLLEALVMNVVAPIFMPVSGSAR